MKVDCILFKIWSNESEIHNFCVYKKEMLPFKWEFSLALRPFLQMLVARLFHLRFIFLNEIMLIEH